MPREPPVTSATLPASSLSCLLLMFLLSLFCNSSLGGIFRKTCSEHRGFTLRLFFGRFILDDIPMLDKDSGLNPQNICGNPIHRTTEAAESPVNNHELPVGDNCSRFVPKRGWKALNEIEEPSSAGFNVSAVLNVIRGPITLSRLVVALIEQRVESFKDKRFVFCFRRLTHFHSPVLVTKCFLAPGYESHGRFATVNCARRNRDEGSIVGCENHD